MSEYVRIEPKQVGVINLGDPPSTIRVSRTFYWAWAQAAVRCPWERVRLLYNAGFRGSDLR